MLTLQDWIMLCQSTILTLTIVIMVFQYFQSEKHHKENFRQLITAFRAQVHERLLADLLGLNRIMLEFPEAVRTAFRRLAEEDDQTIRRRCYVYAVLDLLNFMVIHHDAVDPFVKKHLKNLACLLYVEPAMREVFEDVKDQQSEALVEYLETKIKPFALDSMLQDESGNG